MLQRCSSSSSSSSSQRSQLACRQLACLSCVDGRVRVLSMSMNVSIHLVLGSTAAKLNRRKTFGEAPGLVLNWLYVHIMTRLRHM
eukprot:COSAG01_NODE_18755_length_1055_cov_3.705021_2_plen_85_part_00